MVKTGTKLKCSSIISPVKGTVSGQCFFLSTVGHLSFLAGKYCFGFFLFGWVDFVGFLCLFVCFSIHHSSLVHITAELQGFISCSWVKYIGILKSCLSAYGDFLEKQNINPAEMTLFTQVSDQLWERMRTTCAEFLWKGLWFSPVSTAAKLFYRYPSAAFKII